MPYRLETTVDRYDSGVHISMHVSTSELGLNAHADSSKMMVNFMNDGTCQVVIHTANLLRIDWEEKTESIWLSPRLMRLEKEEEVELTQYGTRFKADFLAYLRSYKRPSIEVLINKLERYDFNPIRAIFVASIPGSYNVNDTTCGLARLRNVLESSSFTAKTSDHTIAQVSSLGSLGRPFYAQIQQSLNAVPGSSVMSSHFKLIFPTIENVRDSLPGWLSGFSLFFNAASSSGARQMALCRANLCSWSALRAGRDRVMPHVKTFARISEDATEIKWILMTSANLSKAALGAPESGRIKIKSYEAGVLLVPELFVDDTNRPVIMRPSYKCDTEHTEPGVVNIRMPYDLQVKHYTLEDEIWSLQRPADRLGLDWLGVSMHELMMRSV